MGRKLLVYVGRRIWKVWDRDGGWNVSCFDRCASGAGVVVLRRTTITWDGIRPTTVYDTVTGNTILLRAVLALARPFHDLDGSILATH